VVTLGPASRGLARELCAAGATGLRLNASHMTADEVLEGVTAARVAAPAASIVVDLQGAKMRLGRFPERLLGAGERLVWTIAGDEPDSLPLPHPELFVQARRGDTLSADDGRLRFEVLAAAPGRLEVRTLAAGTLRPRKGVNVVEHPVELSDLVPADQSVLAVLAGQPDIAFALSFVEDGREAEWVRRRRPAATVIGKVERAEAVVGLQSVAATCDALWICRGDLGAQLGAVALARFVAELEPRRLACPTYMAGQIVEHLTAHAEPTRSEVCHLYDLCQRGYRGFVLSDETAIGRDPVGATRSIVGLLAAFGSGSTSAAQRAHNEAAPSEGGTR
jgi:pyruvate kinase